MFTAIPSRLIFREAAWRRSPMFAATARRALRRGGQPLCGALSDFAREVVASYVDIPTGVFVAEAATLGYISPISLAGSLNESVCALTNSAWILTTSSKFVAWLSF